MKPVGEFREGEIDGKPFFIYSLSFRKDKPSSSPFTSPSSSDESAFVTGADNDLSPLFMCPSVRSGAELGIKVSGGYASSDSRPSTISPHFQSWLDFDCGNISFTANCKLPPVHIFWCNEKEPSFSSFWCPACGGSQLSSAYYFCFTCNNMFHKECVESPLEIKHPSYPFRSLQLYGTSGQGSVRCSRCELDSDLAYRCPINKVNMDPICAMNLVPTLIDHPKRHPHHLTFFPQQSFLQCHVCGLVKDVIPTYVCVQCVFVVHQDCVYAPYVIEICRHQHRISFIYSLPSENLLCGVCHKNIVSYCGAYKCTKCSDYFVHTRCALRKDVWDGIELEGVPEEPEMDIEPFKRISDGIILHFSHVHPLELKIFKVYNENKICQACVLPVYEGRYYSCMDQCDFNLHEECANAPRKKRSILHAHPLILKVVSNGYDGGYGDRGFFSCDACRRQSCGFAYESIGVRKYRLDVRCALISEPFEYQGHKHPLYLALSQEEERSATCQICFGHSGFESGNKRKLNCIECNFVICFYCATLPYKAGYKHDSHLLTFYEMKEATSHSEWCDVCERKIAHVREIGFYSCDECCTTLHVDCLLGRDMYMKPGQTIHNNEGEYDVLRNITMSRPSCFKCARRCIYKLVFRPRNMWIYCSIYCAFGYEV